MFYTVVVGLDNTSKRRGEERFREEGETAQKVGGGGRKDAKK